MKARFVLTLLLAVLCSVCPSVLAQSAATITGVVTDPSGAAISSAEISSQSLDDRKAAPARVRTDSSGRYALSQSPGRYLLRIAASGSFARMEREIALAAGDSLDWSPRLQLERLSATVVVTAHAEPLEAQNSSASVSIISREQIEQRQATSLLELLTTQPGVAMGRDNRYAGFASLFLDGGNSNFTKLLVDGAPLNEPGGALDLSVFSLENVEKVEVVRGAESALFGTDAMSGVVQVFTRQGTTRRPLLHLLGEGGKFDSARGAADLSGAIGGFDYSLAAARFETRGQEPNDTYRLTTIVGNFGYRAGGNHRLRLALRSAASHAGAPGQVLLTPAPNLDQYNALRNFTASFAWDISMGKRWLHRLTATESYIRQLFDNATSNFCDPNPPFICDFPFTAHNRYNRAGLGAQSSFAAAHGVVTLGYQHEVENAGIARGHLRRNNSGGFVDARWSPAGGRLTLAGGLRVEGNDAFGTRAVPRVGIAYLLRKGDSPWGATRLRGSLGFGVKEPTFIQSFGFSTDPCFPGNPDLRPEKSRTANFGVEQRIANDRVLVGAEGFLNRFRDIASFTFCLLGGPCPLTPPPGCPFGFGTFFNTDLARANGANIAVEARPNHWLTLSGNYTYTDSRVLEAPTAFDPALVPGRRLLRRPPHAGNVFVGVTWRHVTGSFSGRFVGPRTDSDFLGLGLTRNPGYAKFDLAARLEISRNLAAFGRIENLFDKVYQENLGVPALGRSYRLGMRFTVGGE
jgi:vitamin B12 transporter